MHVPAIQRRKTESEKGGKKPLSPVCIPFHSTRLQLTSSPYTVLYCVHIFLQLYKRYRWRLVRWLSRGLPMKMIHLDLWQSRYLENSIIGYNMSGLASYLELDEKGPEEGSV